MSAKTDAIEAAKAMVRLNSFAAILALTESGLFPGVEPEAVSKINAICKKAMQAELTKYDAALAAVQKATK